MSTVNSNITKNNYTNKPKRNIKIALESPKNIKNKSNKENRKNKETILLILEELINFPFALKLIIQNYLQYYENFFIYKNLTNIIPERPILHLTPTDTLKELNANRNNKTGIDVYYIESDKTKITTKYLEILYLLKEYKFFWKCPNCNEWIPLIFKRGIGNVINIKIWFYESVHNQRVRYICYCGIMDLLKHSISKEIKENSNNNAIYQDYDNICGTAIENIYNISKNKNKNKI